MRSKLRPGRSGKGSRHGQRKVEAQQATAAGLDLLRVLGWLVLHDAAVPGVPEGDIDHVLAGPSGVYVVHTVSWKGAITMTDQALTVDKTSRHEALEEVTAAAEAVRGLLGGLPVMPMLCFERLEPVTGFVGNVALCSSENILDLLTGQPDVLDPAAFGRVSRTLSTGCNPLARMPRMPAASPAPTAVVAPAEELPILSAPPVELMEAVEAVETVEPVGNVVPLQATEATAATVESPEELGEVESRTAIADAGAALWLELTEPEETTAVVDLAEAAVDVEAALAEAEAWEREVEEAGAREREAREAEARIRAEREAEEAEAREAEDRAAREQRERKAREARERVEREALELAKLEAVELAERDERVRAEQEAREQAEQQEQERVEQEAREAAEQEAREQAEREEHERVELEAREQAEREERERVEQEAREAAEQEAREQAEREERERVEQEAREAAELKARAEIDARAAAAEAREAAERAARERAEQEVREVELRERAEAEARQAEQEAEESAERAARERADQEAREAEAREHDAEDDLDPEQLARERAAWEALKQAAREEREREMREHERRWAEELAANEARINEARQFVSTISEVQASAEAEKLDRQPQRSDHRHVPMRALVQVAIGALLIAVVIVAAPRMSGVVAWGQGLFGAGAPTTVGTAIEVAATTSHPDAEVLAGVPVDVRAAGSKVAKGHHLVAVPFRLTNRGLTRWDLPMTSSVTAVDGIGVALHPARGVTPIKGKPLFPAQVKVAPGASATGYVVFSLTNGRSVRSIELGLSPSGDESVTWQVGR